MSFSTDDIIRAYLVGAFPMAESRESEKVLWYVPEMRAIFDLNKIHVPRSVRQLFRKNIYTFNVDTCFRKVIEGCAEREETWINDEIIEQYTKLHERGFAHSVEVFRGDRLVGGLYGGHIGGAFFGESMFGRESNVVKLAFFYLCAVLIQNKFLLLDSQFINDFTRSLGAYEIPESEFLRRLARAVRVDCKFDNSEK